MLLAFAIVVAVQIFYYLYFFSRLGDHEEKNDEEGTLPPVSIVICAHDEINRLRKNLQSILEQKYPEYEVIVVNDNSVDDTEMFLTRMTAQYPRLVVRDIHNSSNTLRGKKYPLTIGIRAAKYDHVLLTDADCEPSSDEWIRSMCTRFTDKKEIVLGYAPFKKHPGFLNKFIRYESFLTALQYFSFALAGNPYMGVGRNLAYRKNIFFDHNIYPKYPQLLSGDDDLLINAAATKTNVAIQTGSASFMYSEPKQTWEEYWHQKKRHISTAKFYRGKHKLLLGIFSVTNIFFYLLFAVMLIYSGYPVEALLLFVIRLCIQSIVYRTTMNRFVEDDLITVFPLMDILFLLYYVKLFPSLFQKGKTQWK